MKLLSFLLLLGLVCLVKSDLCEQCSQETCETCTDKGEPCRWKVDKCAKFDGWDQEESGEEVEEEEDANCENFTTRETCNAGTGENGVGCVWDDSEGAEEGECDEAEEPEESEGAEEAEEETDCEDRAEDACTGFFGEDGRACVVVAGEGCKESGDILKKPHGFCELLDETACGADQWCNWDASDGCKEGYDGCEDLLAADCDADTQCIWWDGECDVRECEHYTEQAGCEASQTSGQLPYTCIWEEGECDEPDQSCESFTLEADCEVAHGEQGQPCLWSTTEEQCKERSDFGCEDVLQEDCGRQAGPEDNGFNYGAYCVWDDGEGKCQEPPENDEDDGGCGVPTDQTTCEATVSDEDGNRPCVWDPTENNGAGKCGKADEDEEQDENESEETILNKPDQEEEAEEQEETEVEETEEPEEENEEAEEAEDEEAPDEDEEAEEQEETEAAETEEQDEEATEADEEEPDQDEEAEEQEETEQEEEEEQEETEAEEIDLAHTANDGVANNTLWYVTLALATGLTVLLIVSYQMYKSYQKENNFDINLDYSSANLPNYNRLADVV